jgi:hypothetical protein
MATQSDPKFEVALSAWLAGAQAKIEDHHRRSFPTLEVPRLTLERGRRYIRVVRATSGSERSVFAFIDANGDVLKAESWAKPARHARGSIFDPSGGLAGVSPYGPAYLR